MPGILTGSKHAKPGGNAMESPKTSPSLSAQEREALGVLEGYGIDFAPALLGMARRHFRVAGQEPSVGELVDYCIAIKPDPETRRFLRDGLEREIFARLQAEVEVRAQLEPAAQALAQGIRESVEVERSKLGLQSPTKFHGEKLRSVLFQARTGRIDADTPYVGTLCLGEHNYLLKAWIGKRLAFVNVEISLL